MFLLIYYFLFIYVPMFILDPDISTEQRLHILPDFILAFALPILVHDPQFTDHEDRVQLKHIEKCLRFILEPLMAKSETFSYSFYKNLIEMMKDYYIVTPHTNPYAYNLVRYP